MRFTKHAISFVVVVYANFSAPDALGYTASSRELANASDAILAFEGGVSWKNSSFERLYYFSFVYKKPSMLFGWETYRNYELGGFYGHSCDDLSCSSASGGIDLSEFNTPVIGISEQVLLRYRSLFMSFALGGYVKEASSRVGSVFTFGERLAVGAGSENYTVELFIRHYSNASMTPDNGGHNFIGLSVSGVL